MDKKKASIHMKAISIRGTVQNIGSERLADIFEKNPYMNEIYPNAESRKALEVFCITKGSGEYFDLSTKPITRASFVIGEHGQNTEDAGEKVRGYYITDACTGCGKCTEVCPQKCIDMDGIPFKIRQANCLHCGNCKEVCPSEAVEVKR